MKIEDLIKVMELLKSEGTEKNTTQDKGIQSFVGKKVIVRTYSAGVHYGELIEKHGKEVILKNSRRLFYWKNKETHISISEIAKYGVHDDSKICSTVDLWLEAIEIIPCTDEAINSIEGKNVYKA